MKNYKTKKLINLDDKNILIKKANDKKLSHSDFIKLLINSYDSNSFINESLNNIIDNSINKLEERLSMLEYFDQAYTIIDDILKIKRI